MAFNYEPSLTQQHFKNDCDINYLMKRFKDTGVMPGFSPFNPPTAQPVFDDFTGMPDLMDAQNMLIESEARFNALPAAVRRRFSDNPFELLDFVANPDNLQEAVSLGLLTVHSAPAVDGVRSPESVDNPVDKSVKATS